MKEPDSTKISVVMGVFNSPEHVLSTVDSVLKQRGVEIEFIIVDDGSEADTQAVLNEISDPRVTILRQQHAGLTKALIRGCENATADYVARIDVGDHMLADRLAIQAKYLNNNADLVMICTPVTLTTVEGYPMLDVTSTLKNLQLGITQPDLEQGSAPFHASLMFRRKTYQQVGGYRSQFHFAQDLDLWSRMIELGGIAITDEVLTAGVFSPKGLSARFALEQKRLKSIIAGLIEARKNGASENTLLAEANSIRPKKNRGANADDFDGNYFIGKCLYDRSASQAKIYLARAIKEKPYHLKAWWYWLLSAIRSR